MLEGIQRCSRVKMVLPLRVSLDEHSGENLPTHLAHTIDISDIGCRLAGLRTELAPGQTIILQRGQHKARFRVIWSRQLSTNEHQAGIEALDYGENIWGLELPPAALLEKSTKSSFITTKSSATPVSVLPAPVSNELAPSRRAISNLIPLVAAQHLMRWGLSFGLLLLIFALGLVKYQRMSQEPESLVIQPRIPAPPTARDLARLTAKPHVARVSFKKTEDTSAPRLQVAEAPTGHVIYPVAPDDSIGGKVRLQIVIAANGLVKQIYVLSGNKTLAEAAAQAVHFWHFSSLPSNDQSTERETSVTVSFLGHDAVFLEFPTASAQIRSN